MDLTKQQLLWLMILFLYLENTVDSRFSRCDQSDSVLYEGRSINKLQNGIILLIFKT